jgi:hypothetical protein
MDFMIYSVAFSAKDASEQIAKNRLTEWLTEIVYMQLDCDDFKAHLTGSTNFRNNVAVTHPYKGNRKDVVRPEHFDALRKHAERLGATVSVNEEADDTVAIESTKAYYWIVHVDKDLNQLPGWHYNPVKSEEYYVTEDEGNYSFYLQLLTGDRTDNIVGLKGIGPVKAAKILGDLVDEQDLYSAVVKAYKDAGEPIERILENGQLLWLRRYEGELWQLPVNVNQ